MTALIVQARLGSTRLPRKALLPLAGKPLILRVMEALKPLPCDAHVLACPEADVPAFQPLARAAGISLVFSSTTFSAGLRP